MRQPTFGWEGEKARFCSAHKVDGMLDVKVSIRRVFSISVRTVGTPTTDSRKAFLLFFSCSPLRLPVSFVWRNTLHTW